MERITIIPKLSARPADAHKGTFGTVLVVAGSWGMSGAAGLVGSAALRSGAGLVRVAVGRSILPTVAGINPCYTTVGLEDEGGFIASSALGSVLEAAKAASVIAAGPGMGVGAGQGQIVRGLIGIEGAKVVVDADGLNNLARIRDWRGGIKADLILTPHPGEMKRLWQGLFREELPSDRLEQATKLAQRCGAIVVLKGAGTVVTDGNRCYINDTGNPGMATGGTGDVLTGVIAGLWGQGLDGFDAAVLGVYVHGLAGDIAEMKFGQVSLIATDIISSLPEAFRSRDIN